MNVLSRGIRWVLLHWVYKDRIERIIRGLAHFMGIDLVQIAYQDIGILNYENHLLSGENFLFCRVLPQLVNAKKPIFFDVGANIGEVSLELAQQFPYAEIWSFEPNPITFGVLVKNLNKGNFKHLQLGFGSYQGIGELYCYLNDQQSGHASIYSAVFDLYKNYGVKGADKLKKFEFSTVTIDSFCEENKINKIDYLKIDVEGHELEVLKGSKQLICKGLVDAIQFEFADCSVISRVFLKDFYDLLPNYHFYRLNSSGLINLGTYAARNEIFQFQNIFAVRKELIGNLNGLVKP